MDIDTGGLLIVASVLLAAVWVGWHYLRGRELVQLWADRQGLVLEECGYRHLARGPFLWTSSKSQAVYRVRVRGRDGAVRRGWVRCGGWISGVFSDEVVVRWDAETPP